MKSTVNSLDRKDNESKESSKRMGGLEWGGKISKVGGRSQEISISKILQMDPCLWEESEWEDAGEKIVRSCN